MTTVYGSSRHRAAAIAIAVVIGTGLVSGCGDDSEADDGTPTPSPTAPETVAEPFADLEEGWQGVLRDVTVEACPTAAGDAVARGTVLNSATETRDITVLASWLAPGTSDPLLQLQTTLQDVPAGETKDWSVSGALPSDAGQCIVGARSGHLA